MKRNTINKIKEWGILLFWMCFVVGFLYLIITVKEFKLIR